MGVAWILFSPIDARACSCPDDPVPLETKVAWWQKHSTVVFSGEAIKREKIPATREIEVTFAVVEFWKGDLSHTVAVKTDDLPGMSCGYDFRIGMTYLVYAYRQSGALATNSCSGNRRRFEKAGEDQVIFLGKGKSPAPKKVGNTSH